MPRARQPPYDRLALDDLACCHPINARSSVAKTIIKAAPFLKGN